MVDAKSINKSLMYEIDIYKQRFGELDGSAYEHKETPFLALEDKEKSFKNKAPVAASKPGDPN